MANTYESDTDDLLAELTDGILVLTMNRPERRNALSRPMLDAMSRSLDRPRLIPMSVSSF